MTWLTPWTAFWVLAAMVPVLIALYILRLRRARRIVSHVSLWHEAAEDIQANTPFQRLRASVLFLLQLLALCVIGLAIAQPRWESAPGRGGRTVLMIDRSASMRMVDHTGQSRFEQAIDAAKDAIDRLHPSGWFTDSGGVTMILGLGARADVIQPSTRSRAMLLHALDQLTVTDAAASIGEGLSLAQAWSAEPDPDQPRSEGPPARIEVFTDGGLIDVADASLISAVDVWHSIGDPESINHGVEQMVAERDPEDQAKINIFATLANWSMRPHKDRVQVMVDGQPVFVEKVDLPAAKMNAEGHVQPGRVDLLFPPIIREGEPLVEVRLLHGDMFSVDDASWGVVQSQSPIRLHLIGEDIDLMDRALSINPRVTVTRGEVIPDDAEMLVIVGGVLDSLPSRPSLSINVGMRTAHVETEGTREAEGSVPGPPRHPVFAGGAPWEVWVDGPQQISHDGLVDVALEGTGGPLVLAWEEAGDRRVHVAFDPSASSWIWDPSFATFLVDATDWLAGPVHMGTERIMAGGQMSLPIPECIQNVVVTSPSGQRSEWSVPASQRCTVGPMDQAGVWRVSWPGGQHLWPVHVPVETESDPALGLQAMSDSERRTLGVAGRSVPLWPAALVLALLTLLLEWAIYCRRII